MQPLSLLVLLVAAASAADVVKKDEKINFRCILQAADHGIILKDRKFPFYLCNSDDGERMIFAAETIHDEKLDAVVEKETVLKLRDLSLIVTRPKRQFGAGFGGGAANAQSSAFGGGGGGGFGGGPGYYGGGPGFGSGGGFSGAQSSAQAGGFGGGLGFGK